MDWRSLVLFVAIGGLMIAYFRFGQWRKARKLEAIRALLADGRLAEHGTIEGTLEGRPVRVKYADRGEGSTHLPWTEVVLAHKTVQLDLAVCPQGILATAIGAAARGVDVKVGDDRFDGAFIVDGAPADSIRAVLDANVRRRLLDLRPVQLVTKDGAVMVAREKWLPAPDVVPMLDAAREAAAAVDRLPEATPGGAYRAAGPVDASAELAALAIARARTERLRKLVLLGLFGLFAIAFLLTAFWPRK